MEKKENIKKSSRNLTIGLVLIITGILILVLGVMFFILLFIGSGIPLICIGIYKLIPSKTKPPEWKKDVELVKKRSKKKITAGTILLVIGVLIIGGGIVGYFIEKANCPPYFPAGCGFLTSAGGLGLLGLIFLGSLFVLGGLIMILSNWKRIRKL